MENNGPELIYDLGVIGGGIAGAGIARDAALRRMSVILFEQNTFGSGTSSKSSKLIHGGLRYLDLAWQAIKHGRPHEFWKNFKFVFSSLKESHTLAKIAPDIVRPIELVIPVYKNNGQNLFTVCFGTMLYYFLGRMSGPLPAPRLLFNRRAVLKLVPNLNPDQLRGGVKIWDHTADDLALVRATLASAVVNGAEAFEHACVLGYEYNTEMRVYEVSVETQGKRHVYKCRKLINAAGPWIDKVRRAAGEKGRAVLSPVAGTHLNMKTFLNHSVILQAADGRILFGINRKNETRVGTTEWIHEDPDTLDTPQREIDYLLHELGRYFPSAGLGSKDILSVDSGIRPLARPAIEQSAHSISREHQVFTGPSGVMHIAGVKLTDHRRAAEEIVDKIAGELRILNAAIKSCSITAKTPLVEKTVF